MGNTTDAYGLPMSGTTSQRPSNAYTGKLFFDETIGQLIQYSGTSWEIVQGQRSVEAHAADDALLASESGTVHSNTGATGAVRLTLPDATPGLNYTFVLGAAQELQVKPYGMDTISLPSSGVAGSKTLYIVADAVGETVHVVCGIAGSWQVLGYTGTWTAETPEAHTADDTLLGSETGSSHDNTAAAVAVTLVLPDATVGLTFRFLVVAAQELRLDPNTTQTIALPSTGVQGAAGKYLTANAAGEAIELICSTAGEWEVVDYSGTWTAEA